MPGENNLLKQYLEGFTAFEEKLNGQSETFFHEVRKDAVKKLEQLQFPTTKNEEWKFTNVSSIVKRNFEHPLNVEPDEITSAQLEKFKINDVDSELLVVVNGIFKKELSVLSDYSDGVIVDSLSNQIKNNPELINKYLSKLSKIDNGFNALNTAYSTDGVFIYIPDNKIIEKPLQIIFINGSDKNEILSLPRNLIVTGINSQASIITNYIGYGKKVYLTNSLTEIFAGENAVIDFYKLQNESDTSYHVDKMEVYQNRDSVFSHYNMSFGGKLVRSDINSTLDNENITTNYYGLYLGSGKQHIDNHTFVNHAKPNCESNELYKGILDDESRGVFNGKIWVEKDAQKTNAYQSNKTILLSKKASIDTKPQLEIYADDVKCSHGATVGHLDDQAYFYIRSRGVSPEVAKSMLIRAFVDDVVESIKIENLKEQLNHMIFKHLHRIEI
ncbi:MAG: Fe-S cluster assembly protein SufD [Ignavibacteria bacterium]|jgi:Fe-S cluster assembly protein SufD